MFGCYRKGDANDPDTYVAAITAALARYPEDVIRDVTHPAIGLPIQKDFLPTVREVYLACEGIVQPRFAKAERERQLARQLDERAIFEATRNTPEQDARVRDGLIKLAAELGAPKPIDEATGERIAPTSEENAA